MLAILSHARAFNAPTAIPWPVEAGAMLPIVKVWKTFRRARM
jgi:hypothetical protein